MNSHGDFDQGRRDFEEAGHNHGTDLAGMVVDTSHFAGDWFDKYQEYRGARWCVTLFPCGVVIG